MTAPRSDHRHPSRPPDVAALLERVAAHRVPCILVGSVAAAAYGVELSPGDLDLVPDPSPEALARLVALLRDVEARPKGPFGHWQEQADGRLRFITRPTTDEELAAWRPDVADVASFDHLFVTRLGDLDIVPWLVGTHGALAADARHLCVEGVPVAVASRRALVAALEASRRPKHAERLEALRALRDAARRRPIALDAEVVAELTRAGRPPAGPVRTFRATGRACLQHVATAGGTIWIKHGYRLPPGEETVLPPLARRWADRVPQVVTTWRGAVALEELPGHELSADDPLACWTAAATALAELLAGEADHVDDWLALGLRDRRPPRFATAVRALRESPVVAALDADRLARLDAFLPLWIARYDDAFDGPATLVPQDSGSCNIRVTADGPLFHDWADVVVGHPVFSADRLLDQVPPADQPAVIDAFVAPLGLSRETFDAVRRSNVLHEVLRYHDELEWIDPDDPMHAHLSDAVRSQLAVLLDHEAARG